MRRAFVLPASAAFAFALLSLAVSTALSAQQVTRSFDYKPVDGIQNVQLAVEDVRVQQVVFKVPKAGGKSSRAERSEAVVRVDNESGTPVSVGVAVVILDEAGNIVAAGSGATRAGWVPAGSRVPVSMRLPYVSRNFGKARKFTITMEVEPKPAGEAVPESGDAGAS
jgi:hypothetical protein